MHKLTIVDDADNVIIDLDCAEIRRRTEAVITHRTTLLDVIWGILNRNKIGML